MKNAFNYIRVWMFLLLATISLNGFAKNSEPLPADQAFKLSVSFVRPHVVTTEWRIAPDYFLYVSRIKINFSPANNIAVTLPKGELRQDEEHGQFEAYTGTVSIPVTLPDEQPPSTMTIDYQGCSANGFCYPPETKTFMLNSAQSKVMSVADIQTDMSVAESAPTLSSLLTNQNDIDDILKNQNIFVLLLIFLGLGLLLAFTPCVLPMVPILTSIIVGQKHAPQSRQAFFLSLAYVLGMSLTYALAGILVASLGGSVQVYLQKPITIMIISGLFVLLALSLFGMYELRFSRRWHNKIHAWSNKHEGGTYVGVFAMGVLSTLVVSPCVSAPLVGVLIYIGQTGNVWLGASALFAMGLGMGIPLLLIGMSAGQWLPKSGPWMKAVKEVFGLFMVAMAIWLLSRIISVAATEILFGALLLASAVFVGVYLPRLIRFRTVNRTIGFVSAMFGLYLVYNGININMESIPLATTINQPFVVVHNNAEIDHYMTKAQQENKPVILDFYADWCASCVEMDKKVLSQAAVREELSHFMLLRVDLSQNSAADQDIMQRFNIVAPPTMLFFNNSGKEVDTRRIVGELNVNEFTSRIQSFVTASCATNISC